MQYIDDGSNLFRIETGDSAVFVYRDDVLIQRI